MPDLTERRPGGRTTIPHRMEFCGFQPVKEILHGHVERNREHPPRRDTSLSDIGRNLGNICAAPGGFFCISRVMPNAERCAAVSIGERGGGDILPELGGRLPPTAYRPTALQLSKCMTSGDLS